MASPLVPEPVTVASGSSGGARRRVFYYLGTAFGLALVSLLLIVVKVRSNAVQHLTLEVLATFSALIVGIVSLAWYFSRRNMNLLIIGVGFMGLFLIDGFHAINSMKTLSAGIVTPSTSLLSWSWLFSRFFLAFFMVVSLLIWKKEMSRGGEPLVSPMGVIVIGGGLVVTGLIAIQVIRPEPVYIPSLFIHHPGELVVAIMTAIALNGYLRKGRWRSSLFEHWLVLSLVITVVGESLVIPLTQTLFDQLFNLVYLMKVLAYNAVLIGLIGSLYGAFRELRTSREALSMAGDRVQAVVDHMLDGVITIDHQGVMSLFNPAAEEIFGYRAEEVIGQNVTMLMPEPHHTHHHEYLERYLTTGAAKIIGHGREVEGVRKDGSRFPLYLSVSEIREDGRRQFIGTIHDLTHIREVEQDRNRFFQLSLDPLCIASFEGYFVELNPVWENLFGYTMDELKSQPFVEFVHPDDRETTLEAAARVGEGQNLVEFVNRFVARDGSQRWLTWSATALQQRGLIYAVAHDITEERKSADALNKAKEMAESANEAKSQFLANMSHELRTPLNSVIGFSNIMLKNKEENLSDQELGFLGRIVENGKHLLNLINEVLDLSKIEAGHVEIERERFDPGELVVETAEQMRAQADLKGIDLIVDIPKERIEIVSDRGKLKQILINLTGNALKFTERGSVTIRFGSDHERDQVITFEITDTGIGIPDDRLKVIFEAFQQADSSTSREYGGTGLGLSISRSLCEILDCTLEAVSTVGEGSTFRVVLPAEVLPSPAITGEGQAEPERILAHHEPDWDTETRLEQPQVLLIDDDPDSRFILENMMRDFDLGIHTAADGRTGLELARRIRPALILLDLMMPEFTGWDVLRALKTDPDLQLIPVIIVSIVAEESQGTLLGALDLLNKPVDKNALKQILSKNIKQLTGDVLVVDDSPNDRFLISEVLKEIGLSFRTAPDGETALEMIAESPPSLLLTDLIMPGINGIELVERLRADQRFLNLPIIVVTSKDLTPDEREQFGSTRTTILSKGESLTRDLRQLMKEFFQA